eukprot:1228095-Amphidinium_carterae.1
MPQLSRTVQVLLDYNALCACSIVGLSIGTCTGSGSVGTSRQHNRGKPPGSKECEMASVSGSRSRTPNPRRVIERAQAEKRRRTLSPEGGEVGLAGARAKA